MNLENPGAPHAFRLDGVIFAVPRDLYSWDNAMGQRTGLTNANHDRVHRRELVVCLVSPKEVPADGLDCGFYELKLTVVKDKGDLFDGAPVVNSVLDVGALGGPLGIEVKAKVNGNRLLSASFRREDADDAAHQHAGQLYLIKRPTISICKTWKHDWNLFDLVLLIRRRQVTVKGKI